MSFGSGFGNQPGGLLASEADREAGPASSGPAGCPVGTSSTALTIANALARDPVYVDPASSLLTGAQARRLRAKIARDDPAGSGSLPPCPRPCAAAAEPGR
jgi:hypothetical protein